MNRLNARAVATLGAGKYNDGAGLLLHKRKDGGAQWIYRYTIHGRRREIETFITFKQSKRLKIITPKHA